MFNPDRNPVDGEGSKIRADHLGTSLRIKKGGPKQSFDPPLKASRKNYDLALLRAVVAALAVAVASAAANNVRESRDRKCVHWESPLS